MAVYRVATKLYFYTPDCKLINVFLPNWLAPRVLASVMDLAQAYSVAAMDEIPGVDNWKVNIAGWGWERNDAAAIRRRSWSRGHDFISVCRHIPLQIIFGRISHLLLEVCAIDSQIVGLEGICPSNNNNNERGYLFIGAIIFAQESNTRLLVASAFSVRWEYGNKITSTTNR